MLCLVVLFHGTAQSKGGDAQTQIILLNDSAAALEDTNPVLSKGLTQFADEKQKDWEDQNANKTQPLPTPLTDQRIKQLQDQVKLLKAAAHAVQSVYPLIFTNLIKMAKEIERTIDSEK